MDNEDWERQLEEITGSIVFIDEGNRFLPTQRFAKLVQQSDNYFVIATREKLPMLPYSIKEIYGFRESGKFRHTKQKYNEIYHLYGEISNSDSIEPEYVITEDSNSGFDFFLRYRLKNILIVFQLMKNQILSKDYRRKRFVEQYWLS